MRSPRGRSVVALTFALAVASAGCGKTGDALLVLNVTSADRSLDVELATVRTFKVIVRTVPGAGGGPVRTDDTLAFELPDGGTVAVSSTPIVLGVLVSADLGAVTVDVSALEEGTTVPLASGQSREVELTRGARIPVEISLERLGTDGGAPDGGQDALAPSDAGAAGDGGADVDASRPSLVDRQWALWPVPNNPADVAAGAPNPSKLVDDKDGTIMDAVTGLIWQQGVAPGIPAVAPELLTQLQGADYCQTLVLGGYDDWRVPTLIELGSIVDDATATPSIYPSFGAAPAVAFWSATPKVGAPGTAWTVSFLDGTFIGRDTSELIHVRCVRSEVTGSARAYSISGGAVTDDRTQLTWRQGGAPTPMNQSSAIFYCKSLGQGWRLPTKNELLTLVDVSRSNPAIDVGTFPDTLAYPYWSSTPAVADASKGWGVNFDRGTPAPQPSNVPLPVRCVNSR